MDGMTFLWSGWVILTILLFFIESKVRFTFITHMLIVIFLSQFFIPIQLMNINVACVYIACGTCYYVSRLRMGNQLNVLVMAFILALCQASYYLFLILEPLWFSWLPSWMNCLLLSYLSILLIKEQHQRMMILIMGMVISDMLLFIVHARTALTYDLFSLAWLDNTSIMTIMLFIWFVIESSMKSYFGHNKHVHKKEV